MSETGVYECMSLIGDTAWRRTRLFPFFFNQSFHLQRVNPFVSSSAPFQKGQNMSMFIVFFSLPADTYASWSPEQNGKLVVIHYILNVAFQALYSCGTDQKWNQTHYSQNTQPIATLPLHAVMLLLSSSQGFLHRNNRVSPTCTLSIRQSEVCPSCLGHWLES